MNVYEVMFVIQFWLVLGIVGLKLYNVMKQGDFMNVVWSVLSFVAYFVCWGVCLLIFLVNAESVFYLMLFRFETWLMLLVVLLFVVELFMLWKSVAIKPLEPYNAGNARRLGYR